MKGTSCQVVINKLSKLKRVLEKLKTEWSSCQTTHEILEIKLMEAKVNKGYGEHNERM